MSATPQQAPDSAALEAFAEMTSRLEDPADGTFVDEADAWDQLVQHDDNELAQTQYIPGYFDVTVHDVHAAK